MCKISNIFSKIYLMLNNKGATIVLKLSVFVNWTGETIASLIISNQFPWCNNLLLYVLGKKYGPLDVLACVLMSIGLTFFILADSKTQPSFNYLGTFVVYVERFFFFRFRYFKKQRLLIDFYFGLVWRESNWYSS